MGRDACGGAARRLVARAARAVATSRSRSAVIVGTIVLVGYIGGSFGSLPGRMRVACFIRLAFRATPRAFASRTGGLAFGRATMEFRVLGPLEVRRDGRAVALPGGKPRAVLAYCLVHANEPVSAERLALALWGEDARRGRGAGRSGCTCQGCAARSPRTGADHEPGRLSVRVRPGELDLDRFERLVMKAGARSRRRAERVRRAAARRARVVAGPALADLAFEPFAQAEIARLEEQRLAALEAAWRRISQPVGTPSSWRSCSACRRASAARAPARPADARALPSGRQADALAAYRRARACWSRSSASSRRGVA